MQRRLGCVTIECIQGDIAAQSDITAVVNAANAELMPGGGVAGALHRAAGPGLAEECRPLAPIRPGEAVVTGAHDLPNGYVIHALGPVYGRDEPSGELLAAAYHNSLWAAEERGIDSVAFPALSTGAFGYPMEEAAEISFRTVLGEIGKLRSINLIRFVQAADDRALHERVLERVLEE